MDTLVVFEISCEYRGLEPQKKSPQKAFGGSTHVLTRYREDLEDWGMKPLPIHAL